MDTLKLADAMLFLSTLSLRRATRETVPRGRHIIFLSTLSLRRATWQRGSRVTYVEFLSTLSLRRATRRHKKHLISQVISIHALLAESDNRDIANSERKKDISIHALLAESDISFSAGRECDTTFLSTLSLRRATRLGLLGWLRVLISIHALLAESDKTCYRPQRGDSHFYPRSPCGERRVLMGGLSFDGYFYPRSPCGERLR